MIINRIKKRLVNLYKIEYVDKQSLSTYENRFLTTKKLPLKTSHQLCRFSTANWKHITKFLSCAKKFDKYYDNKISIHKNVLDFKTSNQFEYNTNSKMLLDNFSNMNNFEINMREMVAIDELIKEFGKIQSVIFYKYSKTIVKLTFLKREIYFIT